MFDFGSADTVRQCAECAVGRSVRVATNDGHAGQGSALLRAHNVHDALAFIHKREVGECAKLFNVFVQSIDLQFGNRVLNTFVPVAGRGVVVGCGDYAVDTPEFAAGHFQAFKCLRAGYFVNQVAVDVKQDSAVFFFADDVAVPKFIVKGLCAHDEYSLLLVGMNDGLRLWADFRLFIGAAQ